MLSWEQLMRALSPVARRYLLFLWAGALLTVAATLAVLPLAVPPLAQYAAAAAFALLLDIADLATLRDDGERSLSLAHAPLIACASVLAWPLPLLTVVGGVLGTLLVHPAPWWRTVTTLAVRSAITSL